MKDGSMTSLAALARFARALLASAGPRARTAAALVAAGAVLEGVGLVVLVPILALIVSGGNEAVRAALAGVGLSSQSGQLALLLAAFVALMALRSLVLHARDVTLADLQARFVEDLRIRAIDTLAAARWSDLARLQHARLTSLLAADMQRVAASAQYLVQGTVAALMLLVQAAIALWLAPVLAGGVLLLMAAAGVLLLARAGRTRDLGGRLVAANLSLMQGAGSLLGGLKAALAEGDTDRFTQSFAAAQRGIRDHQVAFARASSASRTGFAFAAAAAAALVIAAAVLLAVPAPALLTLVVVLARMNPPAQVIQASLQNLFFGLPSFESVRALGDDLPTAETESAPVRTPPAGPIVLDHVSFAHPGSAGLRALSVTLAPGAIVGIVGASGAGKTTLVDLIAGLLLPQSGVITVGGVQLTGGARAGWRSQIGYVPQDGYLFHGTVRDNLAAAGCPPDVLADALATTGADAVVAALPAGLDTLVGDRGSRLSGGERQRLAITRALLRRPRLLILDEATNAIDVAGEAAVLDALAALVPRPTILIVAHRRESLSRCDQMLALADGSVTSYIPS
ncbi:ATP-binding cassette domain-containing protein [Sphingomonas guangdongensis]|nr:ABC transporter ATP-binding protein [Sphingomonas guangdongensis]